MLNNKYFKKIADRIVGHSKADLDNDQFARHLLRETQKIKVFQSQNALPLLILHGFIYIYFLWDDAPSPNLVIWVLFFILAALYRALICKKIEKKLAVSSAQELYSNELWLFFTGLSNTLITGSGFWWIGIEGTDRAVFAITVQSCIYAIGTTINSSVRFHNLPILIISNMGQGVLFLSGLGREPEFVICFGLVAIINLLIKFGRGNSEIFTETIRIRDEIRQQNLKLEKDKLIIEQALAAAKAANEDKSRFLAAASHDLRQPLYAMTLFLTCLRNTPLPPESINIMEKLEETSSTLSDQFNSLLDLSKFDAGVVEANFSEFYFDNLLENIIEGLDEEAKNKHLDLILETEPVSVITDILLIERLIRNIILNAIHYTDQGTILVKVKIVQNGVHLIICDTGPGIAKEDQEKIFDDFYQINNPSRSRDKGSGLGLAIVKRISDLLKLDIKLVSNLGIGTTFDVYIPNMDESVQRTNLVNVIDEKIEDDYFFENLNILVVDDDTNILEALSRLVETWNCKPFMATSLEEVRNIIDDNKIDFAIIDDMLGLNETGLHVAQFLSTKIRCQPIIVTGNVIPKRLLEIESNGFKVYQKPIEAEKLRKELATIIANSL